MSDPRKNFVCVKCGYVINDTQRHQGKNTSCDRCLRKEVEEKYSKQLADKT